MTAKTINFLQKSRNENGKELEIHKVTKAMSLCDTEYVYFKWNNKKPFFHQKKTTSTWNAFPVKVFVSEDWWSFCLWKPLGIGKVFSWLTYIFLKQTCPSKTRLEVTLMYTFFETTKISSGKLLELAFAPTNARFHWKETSESVLSDHNFSFIVAFEIASIFDFL